MTLSTPTQMAENSDDPAWVKEITLGLSMAVGPLIVPTHSAPKAQQISRAMVTPLRPEGLAASTVKVSRPSQTARENPLVNSGLAKFPTKEIATELPPGNYKAVNRSTAPKTWSVSSTSYCQGGTMADGKQTVIGAVAGNMWPLGTKLRILGGLYSGEIVTVEDRIGWGSQLDFFTWSCSAAWKYGREQITVEAVE